MTYLIILITYYKYYFFYIYLVKVVFLGMKKIIICRWTADQKSLPTLYDFHNFEITHHLPLNKSP
jgi:hypothetical protein